MAVQPARMTQADLGVLPVPQRIRRPRRRGADAHVSRLASAPDGRFVMPVTRTVATPWSTVDARIRGRLRPSAIMLATLIVATMLGLVYLTHVLAAQNARYAVDRLLVERQSLMRTLASQEASIVQWGSEAQVVQWAQREGLDRLGAVVRVKAR
jgi:hypothetical protein